LQFLPPTLNHNLFSGFVQDQITLLQDVSLTLGTKVEHNDYTGVEVEPSGRLQWNATPRHMFWAAISRAVRAPSRVDRDEHLPTGFPAGLPQDLLKGNPNFLSETLIAYELGYRGQFGKKVSASVSTFYNDYDHIRSVSPTPATLFPLTFDNNLKAETYGLELSANYQALNWWRLHGGYDVIKEHVHVRPGAMDINAAHNETADPQQQFFLRSSMDLPGNVELDGALRWIDRLPINQGSTVKMVPSYFEMDVRLAWHATKNLEFSIVGQNLLHDHHPEYGFPSPIRTEIPRSVFGKISWHF
jgi:iron complex outermembrane receptor protein